MGSGGGPGGGGGGGAGWVLGGGRGALLGGAKGAGELGGGQKRAGWFTSWLDSVLPLYWNTEPV